MKLELLISRLKSKWALLSAFAAFIFAIVGPIVASPPTLWREAGDVSRLGPFIISIVASMMLSAMLAVKALARPSTFYLYTGLTIVVLLAYFFVRAEWSCPYSDGRMAIGWDYLPVASDYLNRNPNHSCELLLLDFTGDTDKIWPPAQIGIVWAFLLILYITAISLTAALTVQAMHHLLNAEG